MNRNHARNAIAAALIGSAALACSAHAQSADSLIEKLVQKGVLTSKEARELRQEADKDFNQAFSAKTGMPEWVTALKFNGDFRARYDGIYVDPTGTASSDRNRLRYRLRFGVTAVMNDNIEAGLRFGSAENKGTAIGSLGGDPISGNDSYSNNGSKKLLWIDLAYAKISPLNGPDWSASLTLGKMENPFALSDVMFDGDYTPEGIAAQFGYRINDRHGLKLNTGLFALREITAASRDPYLLGAQLRWDGVWSPKVSTSFGAALMAISDKQNLRNGDVLDVNKGNLRDLTGATGTLLSSFNPIVLDGSLTYMLESFPMYPGACPLRFAGDYVNNPAASRRGEAWAAGLTLGKSGKKGTWDLTYRFKNLESDYWYEELADSDHGSFYQTAPIAGPFNSTGTGYGAGTNIRGHYMRAAYSFYDSFTLSATYYLFDLIDKPAGALSSQTGRLQVDATFKF